jgi:YfiH family protein
MTDAFRLDTVQFLRAPILDRQFWIEHGFGTRNAGAPVGWRLATVKQIHSATVIDVSEPPADGTEGDALITQTAGIAVAVKTADCLPVLLADPVRRVVAAVHAGWRGTVQEIVPATISRLTQLYKTNPPDIVAAIGPGIGQCCYEVGPEVASQFAQWDPGVKIADAAHAAGKVRLDLAAVLLRQLTNSGVPLRNIAQAELCTMDRSDLFFSFRKESEAAGRMFSWIGIRPEIGHDKRKINKKRRGEIPRLFDKEGD